MARGSDLSKPTQPSPEATERHHPPGWAVCCRRLAARGFREESAGAGPLPLGCSQGLSGGRPKENNMPAYVLIRETKKERRAPLRACIAAVAGLGLAGAVLGGTAYGPALAAGLLRFIPVPAPDFQRVSEPSDRVIRIKADSNGQYYVKGSADG